MARAGMYIYESDGYCLLCDKRTEETVRISNPVQDLMDTYVHIPLHRSCFQKKRIKRRIYAGTLFGAIFLIFGPFSLYIIRSIRQEALTYYASTIGLIVALLLGGLVALYFYLKSTMKWNTMIQAHVQLRTIPID